MGLLLFFPLLSFFSIRSSKNPNTIFSFLYSDPIASLIHHRNTDCFHLSVNYCYSLSWLRLPWPWWTLMQLRWWARPECCWRCLTRVIRNSNNMHLDISMLLLTSIGLRSRLPSPLCNSEDDPFSLFHTRLFLFSAVLVCRM